MTTDVKKDFCKLLNNSNFGKHCRSNIDNRTLELIYDKLSEISFLKKYDDIFDSRNYFHFADPHIMREEINKKFDRLTLVLDKNDLTYNARNHSYDLQNKNDLESL